MIHKYFFNSIFYSPLIKGVSIDFFFSSMVLGLDAYLEEKLKKSIFIYYLFIFGKKLPKLFYNNTQKNSKQEIISLQYNTILHSNYFQGKKSLLNFYSLNNFLYSNKTYYLSETYPITDFKKDIPFFFSFNENYNFHFSFIFKLSQKIFKL